jgi:hypothetical protein
LIDIKDISICPDPTCETCQMTRRIMETIGTADNSTDEQVAGHCVALAHAMARRMYGYYRETGMLDDTEQLSGAIDFFAEVVAKAIMRLRGNDVQQRPN